MVFLTFFHRVFFFLIALARSLEILGGKLGLRHFTLGTDSLMVEITRSHQTPNARVSSSSWDLIVFMPQPRGNNVKLLFKMSVCFRKIEAKSLIKYLFQRISSHRQGRHNIDLSMFSSRRYLVKNMALFYKQSECSLYLKGVITKLKRQ